MRIYVLEKLNAQTQKSENKDKERGGEEKVEERMRFVDEEDLKSSVICFHVWNFHFPSSMGKEN